MLLEFYPCLLASANSASLRTGFFELVSLEGKASLFEELAKSLMLLLPPISEVCCCSERGFCLGFIIVEVSPSEEKKDLEDSSSTVLVSRLWKISPPTLV